MSKPQAPNLAQLLSEYYTNRNAGAWSQKAKIGNLKEFNEIVNYLMQNKLTTPEELQERVSALSDRIDTLKSSIENLEQFIQRVQKYKDLDELTPYALRELVKGVYIEAPDKSSGKRRQNIRISYDLVGFIPLNELMKEETA